MRVHLFDTTDGTLRTGGVELVEDWRESASSTIWLDAEEVADAARVDIFEGAFGLHPLAVQDAMRKRHPPKIERFGERLFIMLRGLDATTDDLAFGVIQISVFVGPRFMVTRRTGQSLNTDALWLEVAATPALLHDLPALTLDLAGRVVRRYVPLLIGLEPRLDVLETEIFEKPDDKLLQELSQYKSRLTLLRRTFAYHEQVFKNLTANPAPHFPSDDQQHTLIDVYDQAQRSMSLAELYYSLVDDLQNAYIALAAHRLNQVMRVLTLITVIFVPLSFLAGIYGMNFENMPELHSRFGYYVLLGVMVAIVIVLLTIFRLRRWL